MILEERNKIYSEKEILLKEVIIEQEVLTANISERTVNYKKITEIDFIEELQEGAKIFTIDGREVTGKKDTLVFIGNRRTPDQVILSPIKKKIKDCMNGQSILVWTNGVLSWDRIKSKSTIKSAKFVSVKSEDYLIVNGIIIGE